MWQPWSDSFAEPLTNENQRFVEQSGKWTAFELGEQPPYSSVVGGTIQDVTLRTAPDGKVTGLTIRTDDVVVGCAVDADELHVDIA